MSKFLRVKALLPQPHQPHSFQNLALSVQAGVSHTAGALPALVVKALDGVRPCCGFTGGAPGVIGEIFQLMIAASIQSLVAQGFIVAGAIGDPQPAVFPELVPGFEPPRLFNDRAKDMRRYGTHSWEPLELTHFPKAFSHSLHFLECFFPLRNRVSAARSVSASVAKRIRAPVLPPCSMLPSTLMRLCRSNAA